MRLPRFAKLLSTAALASMVLAGCVTDSGDRDLDNDPPLADVDELFEGTDDPNTIPRDFKADHQVPERFTDVSEFVSPVKSQGRRGVCSIFSTVALMEHLYIKEGTITNPDFSEQYLQWSAKFEVNSFPNTSGSNAFFNLRAINQFGIVSEDVWPYETNQWGTSQDADCTGEDDQPTLCYTNGHPTDAVKESQKFRLPRGRSLNRRDIKAHIHTKQLGVVVGLTFFYQSWNHRKSDLQINADNWDKGIVLFPNDKDEELSLEKRAGHSILVVGWDENMEVARRDENGDVMVDDNGDPVMEKGFYLFKNSWGTSGFGIDNEFGPGWGWISAKYIETYGRVQTAGLPTVERPDEICDDGVDNDFNGDQDCADSACSGTAACLGGTLEEFTADIQSPLTIPDNDPVGITSIIDVPRGGDLLSLELTLDVSHTFRGDLQVSLHRAGEVVVLHDRSGGGANDLAITVTVDDFNGTDIAGEWKLLITDNAAIDTGALNSWSLGARIDD